MNRWEDWREDLAPVVIVVLLGAFILLLMGCCGGPGRITVALTNHTEHSIAVTASMGPLSKSITLAPAQTWEGWFLPVFDRKTPVRLEVKRP